MVPGMSIDTTGHIWAPCPPRTQGHSIGAKELTGSTQGATGLGTSGKNGWENGELGEHLWELYCLPHGVPIFLGVKLG